MLKRLLPASFFDNLSTIGRQKIVLVTHISLAATIGIAWFGSEFDAYARDFALKSSSVTQLDWSRTFTARHVKFKEYEYLSATPLIRSTVHADQISGLQSNYFAKISNAGRVNAKWVEKLNQYIQGQSAIRANSYFTAQISSLLLAGEPVLVTAENHNDTHQSTIDSLVSEYHSRLNEINDILSTVVVNQQLVPGNTSAINLIREYLRSADQSYVEGDNHAAIRLLSQALQVVTEAAANEEKHFQRHLELLEQYYDDENIDGAYELLATIVRLRSDFSEIERWQERLNQLSKLLDARQEVEFAKQIGDLPAEIAALEKILLLTPKDEPIKLRIAAAKNQLRNERFRIAIDRGYKALKQSDVETAKAALADAKALQPSNAYVGELDKDIQTYEKNKKIADYLDAAQGYADRDDWEQSAAAYHQVLSLVPKHNEALESVKFVGQIIAIQQLLDDFLKQPDRLSSANIAVAADRVINEAQKFGFSSARLLTTREKLQVEIEKWSSKIPVRILSDGATEVGIRGIGRVGQVIDRTIELKPGQYVFQGSRRGYRTILIDVYVNLEDNMPVEVTIICDEPI